MESNYPGAYELYWQYSNRLKTADSTRSKYFTSIDVNRSVDYTAYTLSNNDITYFCGTKDAMILFTFKGILQQFSPDGKYLLTIDQKSLRLYPADENEMFSLIDDQKIIGELEPKQSLFTNWYSPH